MCSFVYLLKMKFLGIKTVLLDSLYIKAKLNYTKNRFFLYVNKSAAVL